MIFLTAQRKVTCYFSMSLENVVENSKFYNILDNSNVALVFQHSIIKFPEHGP